MYLFVCLYPYSSLSIFLYPYSSLFIFLSPYSSLFIFLSPYSSLFIFLYPYSSLFIFLYSYSSLFIFLYSYVSIRISLLAFLYSYFLVGCIILVGSLTLSSSFFLQRNDFNGLMAVLSGLSSIAVQRLSEHWKRIPSKSLTEYKDLEALMSPAAGSLSFPFTSTARLSLRCTSSQLHYCFPAALCDSLYSSSRSPLSTLLLALLSRRLHYSPFRNTHLS